MISTRQLLGRLDGDLTIQRQVAANVPRHRFWGVIALAWVIAGCTTSPPVASDSPQTTSPPASTTVDSTSTPTNEASEDRFARVTAIAVTGSSNAYTFAVTIQSPDTGCDQYADWWEVLTEDGNLLYRRILAHSHVDEQPFQRSGGPVALPADEVAIVRAHMHPHGYGTQAMQGTPASGLQEVTLPADFATDLASAAPQPSGCAF